MNLLKIKKKYDDNYFKYEIFVFEILEKLHNKTNQSFRNQLFTYSKMVNMDIPDLKLSEYKCETPKKTFNEI